MIQMVLGRELRCELDDERRGDRGVGICYLAGEDISEVMVRVIWPGLAPGLVSGGRYAEAERQAAADTVSV